MIQRRKCVAGSTVQQHLARRAAGYWLYCLLVVFTITTIWTGLTVPSDSSLQLFARVWSNVGIAVIAALCLLPLIMRDLRWFSNRFVGPVERLSRGLKEMADGESIEPIRFRQDDFWRELADDFNRLRDKIADPGEPSELAVSTCREDRSNQASS